MPTVDLSVARWRKSSFSGGAGNDGDCVEVAFLASAVAVRDSKAPSGALLVPNPSWAQLVVEFAGGGRS